jgi:pseudaminic acid biosynthesis-associated methylase
MSEITKQMNTWSGDFGRTYTDRNPQTSDEMDELYHRQYGVTRSDLNEAFVGKMDRSSRILEVGSNVGCQLQALQSMDFENLYGIELQWYAVERAKQMTQKINLMQGSAFALPFKSGFFDVVFTSGVLIHISPQDIGRALSEIHRCSQRYIWGFEYFAEKWTEIPYRGQSGLLWKTNYARLYLDAFPDLRLVQERNVPYLNEKNVDQMFLLEKVR